MKTGYRKQFRENLYDTWMQHGLGYQKNGVLTFDLCLKVYATLQVACYQIIVINKNKKDHREKNGQGTFNIDQFPSLPQPALGKNGSIFDRDAEW